MERFDLLVVGSGPGGRRAAIQAAKLGQDAAVIERNPAVGGVSVHTGTVPSKTLREAVLYLSGWRQRAFYGVSYRTKQSISAADVFGRVQQTLDHEVQVMRHQLMRNGVAIIHGEAKFLDAGTVEVAHVDGRVSRCAGDKIVISTGTRPHRPDTIPFDGETIVDSDELLRMQDLPRSMTVIGGGVIGVEYATIFSALDIQVTLVDGRERMLEFVDDEIMDHFVHLLRDRGMVVRLGEKVEHIERDDRGRSVAILNSGKRIRSDVTLFAAGRMGATDNLALDAAGLHADARGRLEVNEFYQTEVPTIYAVGDVIGFPALASTSMNQGRVAACHAFGAKVQSSPATFPFGIYAVPEISMVGKTEEQLRAENTPYETGIARFRETSRGHILGIEEGTLKLLFSIEDQRLLGVHIIGEGATELVHIGQAVLAFGGTLDYFLETVFNYPTLAEVYKVAALNAYNKL